MNTYTLRTIQGALVITVQAETAQKALTEIRYRTIDNHFLWSMVRRCEQEGLCLEEEYEGETHRVAPDLYV